MVDRRLRDRLRALLLFLHGDLRVPGPPAGRDPDAAAAAPASAQYRDYGRQQGYGYNQAGGNLDQRIDRIGERIERAFQNRAITRNEYRRLSYDLGRINGLHDRYRQNGLSQREADDIRNRLQNVQQQIREDRQDGRNGRYARDDRSQDGREYRDNRRYDRDDD